MMSLAEWQAVIDVNLTGVFLCGREAARQMIELDSPGLILNISSISKAGNMGQTNYSAAKAGVAAMTVTWARELARYGIRVAGIAPGFIATDMVASMKPEALEKMTAGIPLGRLGRPEEIGHTAVYLFENDYVTGRIIEMDGGLRSYSAAGPPGRCRRSLLQRCSRRRSRCSPLRRSLPRALWSLRAWCRPSFMLSFILLAA